FPIERGRIPIAQDRARDARELRDYAGELIRGLDPERDFRNAPHRDRVDVPDGTQSRPDCSAKKCIENIPVREPCDPDDLNLNVILAARNVPADPAAHDRASDTHVADRVTGARRPAILVYVGI